MIAFGNGNYEVAETFKFTIPLFILEVVTLIISTTLFFPVYA
jgi:di/tricarboxylate transporter